MLLLVGSYICLKGEAREWRDESDITRNAKLNARPRIMTAAEGSVIPGPESEGKTINTLPSRSFEIGTREHLVLAALVCDTNTTFLMLEIVVTQSQIDVVEETRDSTLNGSDRGLWPTRCALEPPYAVAR